MLLITDELMCWLRLQKNYDMLHADRFSSNSNCFLLPTKKNKRTFWTLDYHFSLFVFSDKQMRQRKAWTSIPDFLSSSRFRLSLSQLCPHTCVGISTITLSEKQNFDSVQLSLLFGFGATISSILIVKTVV